MTPWPWDDIDECVRILKQASLPLPPGRRAQFLEAVSRELGNNCPTPASCLAACQRVQAEFRIASVPASDEPSRTPTAASPGRR